MGKALASPRRLELIDLLAQGPRSVDELARATEQSSANTSQHLQALHAAGMVERQRDGAARALFAGRAMTSSSSGRRSARFGQPHRRGRAGRAATTWATPVEAIARGELEERLRPGDLVIVDVRPQEEFVAGHIEGALSIPIDQLAQRLAELPEGSEVIAYCRGPFCAYANQAVRDLRDAGRPARRLEVGWPEWKLAQARTTHITEEEAA